MIPEDKVREVAERLNIVEIIGEYVSLKRSGANFTGLCPFHNEKTPSFNVNPARNIYHCFGCGVGGSPFSFIMKMESISFPEAVIMMGKRVGVEVEERELTSDDLKRKKDTDEGKRALSLASSYFRKSLLQGGANSTLRDYLNKRGVSADTEEAYQIGYAPDSRSGLVNYLNMHKVDLSVSENLGIIKKGNNSEYYDIFRSRLIFPIKDVKGDIVAFGGRIIGEGQPKYLNSPESPLYRKSHILFGMHEARKSLHNNAGIFIVEGYFDHLALFQSGISNVAATCGTAMTEAHLSLIRRYTKTVYLLFDGDVAGQKAAERALDISASSGLRIKVIQLPQEHDPDSFVSAFGKDAVMKLAENAPELFDWFLTRSASAVKISSIEGKLQFLDVAADKLSKMSNSAERGLWIKEISRKYSIEEQDFRRKIRQGGNSKPTESFPEKRGVQGVVPEELLLVLASDSKHIQKCLNEIGLPVLFPDPYLKLAESLMEQLELYGSVDWAKLLDMNDSENLKTRIYGLLSDENRYGDIDQEKMFIDLSLALRKKRLKPGENLRKELAMTPPDSPRHREILLELEGLRNAKSVLL